MQQRGACARMMSVGRQDKDTHLRRVYAGSDRVFDDIDVIVKLERARVVVRRLALARLRPW
jgi:hypothetical protein